MAERKAERKLGRATRDAYGDVLLELAESRPDMVVFDGDLASSTRSDKFGDRYPDRFFNVGIAEANLVGVGAGVAATGRLVFLSSFSVFLLAKGFDQLRMAVAYPVENVKCVGTHGGITLGQDGASQMSIEDFSLALALPTFTVMHPADEHAALALLRQMAAMDGPGYIRLGREKAPLIYDADETFEIGRAKVVRDGGDLTLVACGMLVAPALDAAEQLAAEGVEARVIDVHTLRPLDRDTLRQAAAETGAVVVAEEHLKVGGLGSLVAQALAETEPVPMGFVGLERYAESGAPDELLQKHGLTDKDVLEAARTTLARKR